MLLRRLHGKIYDKYISAKVKIKYIRFLAFPLGKKAYVIGTPDYTNLGDSAITLAQLRFIEKLGIQSKRVKEITLYEYHNYVKFLRKFISANALICGVGGGNMGNQWPAEEYFRYELIDDFPYNPFIVFPQTIHFTDAESSPYDKKRSVDYYNQKTDLTLVARETISYEIMCNLYPDTKVLLTPDIVLSADMSVFGVLPQKRNGVLLCMRSDIEKSLSEKDCRKIEVFLEKNNLDYVKTDMYSGIDVTKENRAQLVKNKMEEFAKSELVITDRLHGMVFAAITGTPCIVFSNYNHKVKGTYEWIRHIPYIRYIDSVDDVEKCLIELMSMKDCKFDNTPLIPYFNKLAEVVKSQC